MATQAELELLIKARDDASRVLGGVEQKAESLGSKLGTVVKAGALAGGAAIVAFGVSSINAAANFEHAVSQIGAVAGATEAQMKGLSDGALRIGKDTAFGATEAAGAMEILAANGVSATDIMEGAADAAVALAAAGGTDLRTAADVASTAMSVWGIKTTEMTDVVNRLAGAANVSRFGVEDMALAVAQGGGAAKTAGVEFGDFTTAIAAIAPSFSSGADAGTSFKTFLVGLTGNSDKAKDAMKELGLITKDGANQFFDASGNMKSMADVTDLLHNATVNLSEQQKIEAFQTIFGTDAMRAAAAMAGLTGAEFKKMDDTMKNTDAAAVAKVRLDNFKGSMDQLKGSIETIQIQIGMKLMPVLSDLALILAAAIPAAADKIAPAFVAAGQAMEMVYNVAEPLLSVLADHPGIILAMVEAWAAFQAVQMIGTFVSMLSSINQIGVALMVVRAEALLFNAAMGGLVVAAAYFVLPAVIDGIKQSFFGANDEAENFARGLEAGSRAAQDLSAIGLVSIQRELRGLGQEVDTEKGRMFDFDQLIAGMVQGLVDGGASIETVMSVIRSAGVANIPAVTKVIDDLSATARLNEADVLQAAENEIRAFQATRLAAELELPAVEEAFYGVGRTVLVTRDDVVAALIDFRTQAHEEFEDIAKSVSSLDPVLGGEVDKWLANIARATAVYTGYEDNLTVIFDALETRHGEHFDNLGKIVLEKTPEEVAAWAELARANGAAFDEGMGAITLVTGGAMEDAKLELQRRLPSFRAEFYTVGREGIAGFIEGMAAEGAYLDYGIRQIMIGAAGSARAALESDSPSKVFMRIGGDVIEGLVIGIRTGLPDVAGVMAEVDDILRSGVTATGGGGAGSGGGGGTGGTGGGTPGAPGGGVTIPHGKSLKDILNFGQRGFLADALGFAVYGHGFTAFDVGGNGKIGFRDQSAAIVVDIANKAFKSINEMFGAIDNPNDHGAWGQNPMTGWMGAITKLRANGLLFDQGGWLPPGLTLAMNNTGVPERVISPGGGGGVYIAPGAIQIIMPHAAFVDEEALRRIGPQLVAVVEGVLARQRF